MIFLKVINGNILNSSSASVKRYLFGCYSTESTMTRDYLSEMKELDGGKVYIKDKVKVNHLINEIVSGGHGKLQFIIDFDRTITKHHVHGKPQKSSFGMFEKCPSLPERYLDIVKVMNAKYMPVEYDPSVPFLEKKKLMEEWWKLSEEILIGLSVSPNEINEVVEQIKPELRDGCAEFFRDIHEADVPILVFSAGLGQTVTATLKQGDVYLPNVKVVANFLKYSDEGVIQGFRDKTVINIFNKNESVLKGTEYYDILHDRRNVIVIGDSLGDASMVNGVEDPNAILKIGFLYEHVKENLPLYMDTFDIVLVDDQTMNVAHSIFKCIS